jgi:hypothetical protein
MRGNVLRLYQKLIATVFLSIAICVGSVGMSAAADLRQALVSKALSYLTFGN